MLEQPATPISSISIGLTPRLVLPASPPLPSITTLCPLPLLATKQRPSSHWLLIFIIWFSFRVLFRNRFLGFQAV